MSKNVLKSYSKETVIEEIASSYSVSKVEAETNLNRVLGALSNITQKMIAESPKPAKSEKKGARVRLSLVGNFIIDVYRTASRKGRNPKSKEELTIPEGVTVKIKAGKNFKV